MPLLAIGAASAFDCEPRVAIAVGAVAVAWLLLLCFNLAVIGGPQYVSDTPQRRD
jgi:hypothetical protein